MDLGVFEEATLDFLIVGHTGPAFDCICSCLMHSHNLAYSRGIGSPLGAIAVLRYVMGRYTFRDYSVQLEPSCLYIYGVAQLIRTILVL